MKRSRCRIMRCRRLRRWRGKPAPATGTVMHGHRSECPLCDRHLDRTTGRHARGGTVWVCQRGSAVKPVNNLLQSRSTVDEARLPRDPRPESVGRGVICWPGGQSLPEGSENCRRRLSTGCWKGVNRPRCFSLNRRAYAAFVSRSGWIKPANAWPQIARMLLKSLDVWPLPLEPWLPAAEKSGASPGSINSLPASG